MIELTGMTNRVRVADRLSLVPPLLAQLRSTLSTNDAATSDEAGSAYIENFALKVFLQADNEDRAGKANKATARKFLAASNFLELLSIFSGGNVAVSQSEDIAGKIKYAKWKAAEIGKAIKEGRKPDPGPPGWDPEEEARQMEEEQEAERLAQEAMQAAKDDDDLLAREIARLNTPIGTGSEQRSRPEQPDEPRSVVPPPTATEMPEDEPVATALSPSPVPGQEQTAGRAPTMLPFDVDGPLTPRGPSNVGPATPKKPTSPGPRSPNFSHPLRSPYQVSSPPPNNQTEQQDEDAGDYQFPSTSSMASPSRGGGGAGETSTRGLADFPDVNGSGPGLPPTVFDPSTGSPELPPIVPPPNDGPFSPSQPQQPSAPPLSPSTSASDRLFPTTPSEPATLPTPSAPPIHPPQAPQAFAPTALAPAPPAPSAVASSFPESLSASLTSKAQRLAKFAISALDYDDLQTASRQLREALDVIEGRVTK